MDISRASRGRRLAGLATGLATAALAMLVHLTGEPAPSRPLAVTTATVAALLLLGELGRLHLEVRRSAITVTLSDAALVVALFTLPPAEAVLLRLAVCGPVLLWLYRRSVTRLAVNTGTLLLESTTCALLLTHLAPPDPTSVRAWLATLVAVQVSGMLAGLAVSLAIVLNGDGQTRAEVVEGLALGAGVSAATGIMGLICVVVLSAAGEGRWLILGATVLGLLAYRGYATLRVRKSALEAVHRFTRSLDGGGDTEGLLRAILTDVPELVGAARAEVVLTGDGSGDGDDGDGAAPDVRTAFLADGRVRVVPAAGIDAPVRRALHSGRPVLLGRHGRRRAARDVLSRRPRHELMVAPLPSEAGVTGAIVASGRLGQVRGYQLGDLMLLETLASHAGIALGKARLVDRLRYDVDHDRLTSLLNRRGVEDTLAGSAGIQAVVALQLTGVREVNDALGHAAGDALIEAVSRRIADNVRSDSPVGRVDDDVLAVLLPESGLDEAQAVADRLLSVLSEPVEVRSVPVVLGAAVGIAMSDGPADLLRRAEIALRAATARGGVRVYESGMEPPSARRLGVAADLRRVLTDPEQIDQLVLFYQPKADLRTGEVHAVEALVRWVHPERGLVPPADFIPVVESTDLVRPLTLHVIDRALGQAARWAGEGRPLAVAVNLSARNLHDPALVDDVAALLRRHRVDPALLTLEITESAVMDDPERAQDVLEGLAAQGLSLSVDDFGTGYSSLAYLARLPVSEVKVDRAFVRRMTSDVRDAAVVRSIVDLGHSLGLRVVAEGVEDDACWAALAAAGVDVAQGFLLSRPLPVAALDVWLAERTTARSPRTARRGDDGAVRPDADWPAAR